MSRKASFSALLALGLFGWMFSSCGASDPPAADGNQQVQAADPPGLAQLSEADRKLAKAQKNCPVSGEPLGGMGKPIKLSVKSRTVFLCCNGCKAEFLAHTDKYLKKLDQSK